MIIGVDTTELYTKKENFKKIDNKINELTATAVASVKESESFGIMTACVVDGEFQLCSDYEVPKEIAELLEIEAWVIAFYG